MTAISNSRFNTITRIFDWRAMDYEMLTCAEFSEVTGQFGVTVQDHPHNATVGRRRVSTLTISSITRPGGNTSRYNFSGTPNLSTVLVGDFLHSKDTTSAANKGRFPVTAVSDAGDWIEILNPSGVAQGGAVGTSVVSYSAHTQSSLDDEPVVGEFNADTRSGLCRIVLNPAEITNVFIVQYEGGGSASNIATILASIALAVASTVAAAVAAALGISLSQWTPYTPTFTSMGTIASSEMFYRRLGDSMQIKGSFTIGTPSAAAPTITLGGGLNIDTAKVSATAFREALGQAFLETTSTNSLVTSTVILALVYNGTASVLQLCYAVSGNLYIDSTGAAIVGAGITINILPTTIPISGWT